jgi:SAM-dependent methyltransferase
VTVESSLDHAICDYEGTSYRARFWDGQGREYEDLAERIALHGLLPPGGRRIVEIGAGFGRLAELYAGYDQVVLLDYAVSGLREAQERLGTSGRFVYVAADLYRLPLAPGTCDTAVTVRVLHHLEDVPAALRGIAAVLRSGGTYVLEYANKRNLKAVARYLLRRQSWSPFTPEPYEFVRLNFDFHPDWIVQELQRAGFIVSAGKAVSHFRYPFMKRVIPARTLAAADGALQDVGAAWKLSPSIFLQARTAGAGSVTDGGLFCCPTCRSLDLKEVDDALTCGNCGAVWSKIDGIYDFKQPRGADLELANASQMS